MKNIVTFILGVIIITLSLYSCSSEPSFPDPGLDSTKDVRDTVRRDTIDTYFLKMRAKVPNKVNTVLILDGLTYQEIERIDQYNGMTEFDLIYPVDLTSISDEEINMNFIVKVIDNDMRSYNKAFSLFVKPFSTPVIKISGVDGTLGLVSPVFQLNALFETGLNNISNYSILFENELIDEREFNDAITEFKYSKTLSLDMQKGETYDMKITLEDDKGNVKHETLQLKLIDVKKPTQIFDYVVNYGTSKLQRIWEFNYNPNNSNQLDRIDELRYSSVLIDGVTTDLVIKFNYVFTYSEFGMVTKFEMNRYNDTENKYNQENAWTYLYEDQNRLTAAKKNIETQYDMRFGEWFDDNRVKGFAYLPDYPSMENTNWHTHASGEEVLADVWHVTGKPGLITRLTAVSIPSYVPSLPAFIPERPNQSFENIQILLMSKYGPESVHVFDPKKGDNYESYAEVKPQYEYDYVTNTNGRLEKIVRKVVSPTGVRTVSRYFLFVYE